MAIGAMMGAVDDVGRAVARLFGRARKPAGMFYDPANPQKFMNALRAGDKTAIDAMHKMHYGSFYSQFGKATGMNKLAERELMLKGKGLSGAIFGRPMKGLGVGLSHLKGIGYFALGAGLLESTFAERGHHASGMVKGVARTLAFAVGDVAGSAVGGPVLGAVLGTITEKAGAAVGDAFQMFHDFNKMTKHVNMGGNYEDTRVAYTMRQRAAQEMGSSVMNARTWLGKEAALLHQ